MGKPTVEVYDYLYSLDWSFCYGPVTWLNAIFVKEEQIWVGRITAREDIWIDNLEAFGGDAKEGGVQGMIEFYPGDLAQESSSALNAREPDNAMPGYRGICHLFFRGEANDTGFSWITNNPYMPGVEISVTRLPDGLDTRYKEIWPMPEDLGPYVDPTVNESGRTVLEDEDPVIHAIPHAGQLPRDTYSDDESWVDLFRLLDDPSAVAAGGVVVTGGIRAVFQTAEPAVTSATMYAQIEFADANGDLISTHFSQYGQPGVGSNPIGITTIATREAPSNARYFRVSFRYTWDADSSEFQPPVVSWLTQEVEETDIVWAHDEDLSKLPDANPAHILYEVLTNQDWGLGEPATEIDVDSFILAAHHLYSESFGISIAWSSQGSIHDFAQLIIDHIKGLLFRHPRTGKWTLRLLRPGIPSFARPVDKTNGRIVEGRRRSFADLVDEIIVTYTDAATEESAKITVQNLAVAAQQGTMISQTKQYPGIRNAALAKHVAERDLREASYPMWSGKVAVDQAFYDVLPGDLLTLTFESHGLSAMQVRVMSAPMKMDRSREIVLHVTEDVFALESSTFETPQSSLWTPTPSVPDDMEYAFGITTPVPSRMRGGETLSEIDADDPGSRVLFFGDDPGMRPSSFRVVEQVVSSTAQLVWQTRAEAPVTRSTALLSALDAEAISRLPASLVSSLFKGAESAGDLIHIGSDEAGSEIVALLSLDSLTQEWTIARGVWDTVPLEHEIGTRLYRLPSVGTNQDGAERISGDSVTYRFLPILGGKVLNASQASDVAVTVSDRAFAPFRPANCALDGVAFGLLDYSHPASLPSTIRASWANRNRGQEDANFTLWNGGNVSPEAGQEVELDILSDSGIVMQTVTGLTGTYHDLDPSTFAVSGGWIQFFSRRDSYRSITGHRIQFDVTQPGYGVGYGAMYG